MHIRIATPHDITTLVELRLAYLQIHFGELKEEEKAALLKQLPEYFEHHLEHDFIAYIAEYEGKAVSTAYLVINEKPANPHFITGKTGLFLNVYTHPNYRRRGIATKILTELIKEAKHRNLTYIELSATEEGRSVYEKLGFKEKALDHTEMQMDLF